MNGAKSLGRVKVNTSGKPRIHVCMSGKDILAKVRRAVYIADSVYSENKPLAQQLLQASERCHEAHRELLHALEQLQPATIAGEQARAELVQRLGESDCGDKLLSCVLESEGAPQSEIHTATPRNRLQ